MYQRAARQRGSPEGPADSPAPTRLGYRRCHSLTFPTLAPFGWSERWEPLLAAARGSEEIVPGRVVRHDGVALALALPDGVRSVALSRQLDPPPAVGDWVVVRRGVPVAVLPRMSLLTRRSARRDAPQQLAANVDGVLIVCGLDRPLRAGRVDRVATLAWDAGAEPALVLAKADLADEPDEQVRAASLAHPGIDVVATSVVDGRGLDGLRALVAGRTVVLVGESGAGKSSLTNVLVGEDVMATGAVRAADAKGRHTTTTREAHPLPGGGVLIDTPGLRSVGLWADHEAVATAFADVDDLAAACRFANCNHASEPGCAVRAALADGTLPPERLAGWQALGSEAAADRRARRPRPRGRGRR